VQKAVLRSRAQAALSRKRRIEGGDRPVRNSQDQKERPGRFVMQLKNVSVLITGGGSGLGAATARAMAAKGANVAVLDQSKENAEKVSA
jgi:NADPH:quinone reductase-like Zn-dependent oxidoreductase